jgi:hypothetical protein
MIAKTDAEAIGLLEDIVERGKKHFPQGFSEFAKYSEEQIEGGRWPSSWAERAGAEKKSRGPTFALAVLEELRILFCGTDKKYDEVRKSGKNFAKIATTAVGGFVAGRFGVELAIASSAAAAGLLLVVRVGAESFCRAAATHDHPK